LQPETAGTASAFRRDHVAERERARVAKIKLTKKTIVDSVVRTVADNLFGDRRDGKAPSNITLGNFVDEMRREGAKGLRARLNRMSFDALVREFVTEQPAKWEKVVVQFLSLERGSLQP
jgi:hypothetical protein